MQNATLPLLLDNFESIDISLTLIAQRDLRGILDMLTGERDLLLREPLINYPAPSPEKLRFAALKKFYLGLEAPQTNRGGSK